MIPIALLLTSLINICTSDCVLDNRGLSEVWENRLHQDLQENYEKHNNPNKNATTVKIWFLLKDFELDSEDFFTIHSWVTLQWTDERLKWEPSKYDGLTQTNFFSHIYSPYWTPKLVLNNGDSHEFGTYVYEQCKLEFNGKVTCVPRITDTAMCQTKLLDWPYDIQRCTLEYGISKWQRNVRLVSNGKRAISMVDSNYGMEWTIVDYEQYANVSDAIQLKFTFVLERNGGGVAAIIVFPAALPPLLTVSCLLMDVQDQNRTFMMIFDLMCHCLFLSEIGWKIPKHSADIPTILKFYRFSIVVNVILFLLSVCLSKLRNRKTVPPSWLIKLRGKFLESPGRYFLWPRWELNNDLLTSDSEKIESVVVWNVLANIINNLCLYFTILVYFIMLCKWVPISSGLAGNLKKYDFI